MDKYAGSRGVISVNAGLVAVRMIHTDEDVMIAHSVCHVYGLILEKEHDHEKGG